MSDPLGSHESVQLMQEHAATMTRKLPFRISSGTLAGLLLFTALAAMGLSIQVKKIRGQLEKDPTVNELEAQPPPQKAEKPATKSESEMIAELESQEAMMSEAMASAFAKQEAGLRADLVSGNLGRRTRGALALRETERGCRLLLEMLHSSDAAVRREAANALSLSPNAPTVETLEALLHLLDTETDELAREFAAQGVGLFAHILADPQAASIAQVNSAAQALERLRERAHGSDAASPESSTESSAGAADELIGEAIERLSTILRTDPSGWVRRGAAFGLAYIQDPRALPALTEAAKIPDGETQYRASLGLVRIADRHWRHTGAPEELRAEMLSVSRALLSSANARVRAKGAEVGGASQIGGLTNQLMGRLDAEAEPSWEVRARSCEALGRIYAGSAVGRNEQVAHIVAKLVSLEALDADPAVRWKAREALQRMGYDANEWGKLEMLKQLPEDVLAGDTAKEFLGSSHEH